MKRETCRGLPILGGDQSKDDLTQAAACLESVATEQPKDTFVQYRLGLVYQGTGRQPPCGGQSAERRKGRLSQPGRADESD